MVIWTSYIIHVTFYFLFGIRVYLELNLLSVKSAKFFPSSQIRSISIVSEAGLS